MYGSTPIGLWDTVVLTSKHVMPIPFSSGVCLQFIYLFIYFFILIYWENHYLFLDWRSSSLCSQDRSQVNLGTAEPAIVRPCMSVLLQTLLQQDSCFSWLAGPAWKKFAFQDLHSACFHAYEASSHLYTVLTWPSAEQEFFEPSFVQKEMSRI